MLGPKDEDWMFAAYYFQRNYGCLFNLQRQVVFFFFLLFNLDWIRYSQIHLIGLLHCVSSVGPLSETVCLALCVPCLPLP